jgi:hypothetical protein
MIKTLLFAIIFALWNAPALATRVTPKGLEELVASADHILVARIDKVDMVDLKGKELLEGRTGPGHTNTIRFHLTIEKGGVLKSAGDPVPDQVLLRLWPEWHYTLATLRKQFQGQTYIFLLKGPDYQWVYPAGFNRPLSEKADIERLLGPATMRVPRPSQ